MIVRAWVIVGGWSVQLPEERYQGWFAVEPPDASRFVAGDWCRWAPTAAPVVLVCVDLPVVA